MQLAERVGGLGASPFTEMTALAQRYGAVNLGQGFPDFGPPPFLLAALGRALESGAHQYAPPPGLPALRVAVADLLAPTLGFKPDPEAEVTVTAGATEAMLAALLALVRPDDEVVVLEPAYDSYAPQVRFCGGVPVPVMLGLNQSGWALDEAALRAAVTPRTRALIMNTPHNPTGKVFTRAELEVIATLAQAHDLTVLSDEVYDQLWFERPHLSIASLPGMRGRTVTLGSSGKSLNVTGWRVGWAVAAPELSAGLRAAHQFNSFCAPTPLQAALAEALPETAANGHFETYRAEYRARRDRLASALTGAGFGVLPGEGSFFLLADWTAHAGRSGASDDAGFCRWLAREVGVAAIPMRVFVSPHHADSVRHLIRFAFCKTGPVLDEAAARLGQLSP